MHCIIGTLKNFETQMSTFQKAAWSNMDWRFTLVNNKGMCRKFQNLYFVTSENSPALFPNLQHKLRRKSFLFPSMQRGTHSNCAKRNITNTWVFPFPPKPISHTAAFPIVTVRLSDCFSLNPSLTEHTLKICLLTIRLRRKKPMFFLSMDDGEKLFMKKRIKIPQK